MNGMNDSVNDLRFTYSTIDRILFQIASHRSFIHRLGEERFISVNV